MPRSRQGRRVRPGCRLMPLRGAVLAQRATRPSFRDPESLTHCRDARPAAGGAQQFPRAASWETPARRTPPRGGRCGAARDATIAGTPHPEAVRDRSPLCLRCAGTIKMIAVIEYPAVVRQILDHLGCATAAPSFRAPSNQLREWSYQPLFDDLRIPVWCSDSRGRGVVSPARHSPASGPGKFRLTHHPAGSSVPANIEFPPGSCAQLGCPGGPTLTQGGLSELRLFPTSYWA